MFNSPKKLMFKYHFRYYFCLKLVRKLTRAKPSIILSIAIGKNQSDFTIYDANLK